MKCKQMVWRYQWIFFRDSDSWSYSNGHQNSKSERMDVPELHIQAVWGSDTEGEAWEKVSAQFVEKFDEEIGCDCHWWSEGNDTLIVSDILVLMLLGSCQTLEMLL